MTVRSEDTLLQCLLALCRYHGCASTPEALTSGLPLEGGCLTPGLFSRAADRSGLVSRILQRESRAIDDALLPAVLILKDQGACLLMGWNEAGDRARVVYPEINDAVVEISADRLLEVETATAIICRPRFRFDQSAPKSQVPDRKHWFWDAVKANLPVYKDVLLASFFINLFSLSIPLFVRIVYDRVLPTHAVETLWVLAIGVVIILVADLVLRMVRAYFIDLAARRVDIDVSAKIMERVLGSRLEYRPASVGSSAVTLRAFERIRDFIASSSVTTLVDLPFAVVFMIVIAWIALPMVLPSLAAVLVILLYAVLSQKKLRELTDTVYRAGAMRNSTLIEGLVGLETVKAIGAESRVQKNWEETTSFLSHVGVQSRLVSNSAVNITQFAQHLVSVCGIIIGVYLIAAGQLTFGGLIACHILGGRAIGPFTRVAGLLAQYHYSSIALENLNKFMDQPVEHPEGVQFISREVFKGDIEFKNVSFHYPGSDVEALSGVTFKIKAGEHVAILGKVGSGKSTLQRLCLGLYQPTSGSILVDGIDLRQLDPTEYRSTIGYAPQDVMLFKGSLRDNLTISHPEVSDESLVKAAEIAGLLDFVNRHPNGFDMEVGERGDALSGGQRKSVALARAIIHGPPIIFMDEPTGSMDKATETRVRQSLREFIKGRTWVTVTHRSGLLKLVDRILVIEDGKLVADGPRDQVTKAMKEGKIGKVSAS